MGVKVEIISVEGPLWQGEAEILLAPAVEGEIGVMENHAPLITPLKSGDVIARQNGGQRQSFYIGGGVLEVQGNKVVVLADAAVNAEDLNEAAILEAKMRAEEALKDKSGKIDYARVQAQLLELVNQLRSIERLRQTKK